MGKYIIFLAISFQSFSEYRTNLVISLIGDVISFLVLYLFWTAVLGTGVGESLYTKSSLAAYFIVSSLISTVTDYDYHFIADNIRNGTLSSHLIKPYNFKLISFLNGLPKRILSGGIALSIFIVVTIFGLIPILSVVQYAAGLLFIIVAVGIRFFTVHAVGSAAFWFNRVHGFNYLILTAGALFSGALIPLDLMPPAFKIIALYLPFQYVTYVPTKVLTESNSLTLFFPYLAVGLFWLAITFIISKIIWTKGIHKFEAAGN